MKVSELARDGVRMSVPVMKFVVAMERRANGQNWCPIVERLAVAAMADSQD